MRVFAVFSQFRFLFVTVVIIRNLFCLFPVRPIVISVNAAFLRGILRNAVWFRNYRRMAYWRYNLSRRVCQDFFSVGVISVRPVFRSGYFKISDTVFRRWTILNYAVPADINSESAAVLKINETSSSVFGILL